MAFIAKKTVKPITPAEAKQKKAEDIPAEIIDAFNELITENLALNGTARFTQSEVVARIHTKMNIQREAIFANRWLDVEPIFRKVGWTIGHDKPAYCESYDATFSFSPKPVME